MAMLINLETQGVKDVTKDKEEVKVLLVDDKKEDRLALKLILGKDSYNFIEAASGREALRILLKVHDFAIILMDVHMPLLDGFETARMIRDSERLKDIPIVFLTANDEKPENIFKGYKTGAVDYMIKPVIPEILAAKVQVFAELFRKNRELERQKINLLSLYKELERSNLEIKRSNSELEKFAYVASHDMQEPLRTIISYLQLLQEKLDKHLDKETEQYMDYVIGAGYRMRDLITGLLEYSRINRTDGIEEEVDVNLVLKEVLGNLGTTINESKATIVADKLPVIKGGHLHLVRLFQNLISNAIKFSGQKEPRIKISHIAKDGFYQFSVEDNGIGIDPKYGERIFEIFQRLHPIGEYPGMGIGLAICKKIVERHGGKIWVESQPGKGSTFFFIIAVKPLQ